MLLNNLLETTLEYFDNNLEIMNKFKKWLEYNNSHLSFEINIIEEPGEYIPFYNKDNKLIAKMYVMLIYRYISNTNTLYWRFSDISKSKDYSMKELWDYVYHLDSKEFGFIRLLILNSGLNIKNKETFIILNSIISYILKINLLFNHSIIIYKDDKIITKINDYYHNLNDDIDTIYNNHITVCYGIKKIEILDKNNNFITALEKGSNKINLPKN